MHGLELSVASCDISGELKTTIIIVSLISISHNHHIKTQSCSSLLHLVLIKEDLLIQAS